MTTAQAAKLLFGGSVQAAQQRLYKLKARRIISERPKSRPYDPSILHLTKRGYELLLAQNALGDYPVMSWRGLAKRVRVSPMTLQHELSVMDFKAAVHAACAASPNIRVSEFCTWPRLIRFTAPVVQTAGFSCNCLVKPDGRIKLCDEAGVRSDDHILYVEVDRSTIPLHVLQRRMQAYASHYRSGGLAIKLGGRAEEYKQYAMRVLWLCKSRERAVHLAEACLSSNPPIRTMMWFAKHDEALSDPLGAIWLRPVDIESASGARHSIAS